MHITWFVSENVIQENGKLHSVLASIRYRVILPASELVKLGNTVHIVNISKANLSSIDDYIQKSDVVIIAKSIYSINENIVELAHERECPVIVDACDNHFVVDKYAEHFRKLIVSADVITTSTKKLHDVIKLETGRNSHIVLDPFEGIKREVKFTVNNKLKLLWFGHAVNLQMCLDFATSLTKVETSIPIEFVLVTSEIEDMGKWILKINSENRPKLKLKFVKWSCESVWEELAKTDIVVIPSNSEEKNIVKSPNRLIESLVAGRAVVAYPLPAYEEFEDWAILTENLIEGISNAIENQEAVRNALHDAQEYIEQKYNPKIAANQVIAACEKAIELVGNKGKVKLNLGCGDKILKGYTNVDVAENRLGKSPDVICDLHDLSKFESDSVDEILSVHVVEHFWRWEVEQVLAEWIRVIKPGGKLILECPNLISACEEFLKNPDSSAGPGKEGQRSMWVFYGDPSWKDPLMVHRWGYTPNSLADLMTKSGLVNVRQEPAQYKLREPRDMRIVGNKPE